MKNKVKLLAVCMVILSIVGCSSWFGSGNTATATSSGKSCGKAISTLYKEYKRQGKIDVANPTALTCIVQIAAARNVLKENKDDKAFLSAFTMGLVSGSNNLITNLTSNNIINALLSLSALNDITTNTPSGSSTAGEAGKALLPLMKSVGK
ncbi:MAG: hypothetical protein IJ269_02145 [Bacteroidales bacterium]|nr:hypothetical protein [Bacteroidales bacterium]